MMRIQSVLILALMRSPLLVLAALAGKSGNARRMQDDDERVTPTAYTTSGGGFFTMTNSMGMIRSWDQVGLLEKTTHFGGNSGGSWFQLQFSYSKDFYESALGMNSDTVQDFLSEWGRRYEKRMSDALNSELFQEFEFQNDGFDFLCPASLAAFGENSISNILETAIGGAVTNLEFPATNWKFYVTEMLSSYLPEARTALWSSTRNGHPDGIIVVAATLPPDAYQFDVDKNSPTLVGMPEGADMLPIRYVARPGEDGDWDLTAGGDATIEIECEENCRFSLFGCRTTRTPFSDLPSPTLSEVSSASSSAGGITGSPTLFSKGIDFAFDNIDNLPAAIEALGSNVISQCLPFGLQDLATPTEGNNDATTGECSPFFRFIDGAYTENTAIVGTIAEMQQSCIDEPDVYDCERNGVRIFNVVSKGVESVMTGDNNAIPRLFANCDCGTTDFDFIGEAIDTQIFAEDFPRDLTDESVWTKYSDFVYEIGFLPTTTESYGLRIEVTTVDNVAFGVTGGMKVELVVLFPDPPGEAQIIVPGRGSEFVFSEIYAAAAQEQYASARSLFEYWNLGNDWGNGDPIGGVLAPIGRIDGDYSYNGCCSPFQVKITCGDYGPDPDLCVYAEIPIGDDGVFIEDFDPATTCVLSGTFIARSPFGGVSYVPLASSTACTTRRENFEDLFVRLTTQENSNDLALSFSTDNGRSYDTDNVVACPDRYVAKKIIGTEADQNIDELVPSIDCGSCRDLVDRRQLFNEPWRRQLTSGLPGFAFCPLRGDVVTPTPCIDDAEFKYVYMNKKGKEKIKKNGCDFVANKRKKRCRKKINGRKVEDICPSSCRACDKK